MIVWHIFKKDWTLLWRYVAGFAAFHFGLMAALLRVGRFRSPSLGSYMASLGEYVQLGNAGGDRTVDTLTNVFPLIAFLASALLITAIVQQDAIPGVRQDWLVRPIRRRDLLLAKLVGVLIMVLGPIFTSDVSGALLNGFPLRQAVAAALGHSLWLWFMNFLPVFAFAALTRNFMEAIVGGHRRGFSVVINNAFARLMASHGILVSRIDRPNHWNRDHDRRCRCSARAAILPPQHRGFPAATGFPRHDF